MKSKQNKFKIKKMPKDINKHISERYIEEIKDNDQKEIQRYLKIKLDDEITPIHDLLIKLYYYPYLKYIYEQGAIIFYKQLEEYMEKVYKENPHKTRDIVKEMELFNLIKTEIYWNNSSIRLTKPAMLFFGEIKRINKKEIGEGMMSRRTFIAEHYNKFNPTKREALSSKIIKYGFMTAKRLEQLKMNNIFVEDVIENSKGEYLIVLGLLDFNQSLEANTIVKKIKLVNSFINPSFENVFFRINICAYNNQRHNFLLENFIIEAGKEYLEKHQRAEYEEELNKKDCRYIVADEKRKSYGNRKIYSRAEKLRDIKFTNLNVERFFKYSSSKRK
ncbi:MAG: hypothetical protein N4A62_21145 [Marinisporobacter sp.]|jgi:hypothetical protein|nr:hypothetical protein [Marinisporobacter sp.]